MCFCLLAMSFSSNQTMDPKEYDKLWKEVQNFENDRKPKSALQTVEKILAKARTENNDGQVLKSIIYYNKFVNILEEEGFSKAIKNFETEIENSTGPRKAILESLTAELFGAFARQNIYQFQQRTNLSEGPSEDIKTWTLKDLNDKAAELYLSSVATPKITDVPLDDYKEIISQYSDKSKELRPSLYLHLSERAIQFFSQSSSFVTEPIYKFELNQQSHFESLEKFIDLEIESKDKSAHLYLALKNYQDLLSFTQQKGYLKTLADFDLERLKYVNAHSIISDKRNAYQKALVNATKSYREISTYSEVCYELARLEMDEEGLLSPEEKALGYRKALSWAEKGMDAYPKSIGAYNCSNIIRSIKRKDLRINYELVQIPNQKFLIQLEHKNAESVHFKIIRSSHELIEERNKMKWDKRFTEMRKKDFVHEWNVQGLNMKDYLSHSTEVEVPSLEKGMYMLLASTNPDFKDKQDHAVFYGDFHVSNLATSHIANNETSILLVANRTTSEGVANATVEFYKNQYNANKRQNDFVFVDRLNTDKDGVLIMNKSLPRNTVPVVIKDDDKLDIRHNINNYRHNNHKGYTQTFIYTDRSIYRPGQTIYFKGIQLRRDEHEVPSIVKDELVNVSLLDANGQEVSSLQLKTNEYGSIQGHFVVPSSGLNGRMRIHTNAKRGAMGNNAIRVEEYKRPQFSVEMDPFKDSKVLGDVLTVKGKALSFTGTALNNSKIQYRITRNPSYRRPYYNWYSWQHYPSPQKMIDFGVIETKDDGSFELSFKAEPDHSVPKKSYVQFSYNIQIDVTDINGETQSTNQLVTLAYNAFDIKLDIDQNIVAPDLKEIAVSAVNKNGEKIDAEIKLKIESLKAPKGFFKERYWNQPDHQIISEEGFYEEYGFSYKNESRVDQWPIADEVLNGQVNTSKESNWMLTEEIPAGSYKITASANDEKGKRIETIRYVHVSDLKRGLFSDSKLLHVKSLKDKYLPGDMCDFTLATSQKDLDVYYFLERQNRIEKMNAVSLSNKKEVQFKISERDQGGVTLHVIYFFENRYYKEQYRINVPWEQKDLQVSLKSFRSVLEPGGKEKWTLKISGDKKDKIQAEVLSAMYDASLDQFVSHSWNTRFYPNYYTRLRNAPQGFYRQSTTTKINQWSDVILDVHPKFYDPVHFSWFGFPMYSRRGRQISIRGSRSNDDMFYTDGVRVQKKELGMNMDMESAPAEMDAVEVSSLPTKNVSAIASTAAGVSSIDAQSGEVTTPVVQVRENLNETVFFYPQLKTDEDGNIEIEFTMNEALTQWKWMSFAHSSELKFGYEEAEITTKKDLMVFPNLPRFTREGDKIKILTKISNVSDKTIVGQAQLSLLDAVTMQEVDGVIVGEVQKAFSVEDSLSTTVSWDLHIPNDFKKTLAYKIIAFSDKHSDGELNLVPNLTNRKLVTESLVMHLNGQESKTFELDGFSDKHQSKTLQDHQLTLEFTSNPVWYAVQALPYMMEFPHDCTEQILNRFYANTLASYITNSNPKIKQVFEEWKRTDSDALKSNLSNNESLKEALIEETPWVLDAMNEEEQKRNIALLFDFNRMAAEKNAAIEMLKERILSNGGFPWFSGRDNVYVTQYFLENVGHLEKLEVLDKSQEMDLFGLRANAQYYADSRMSERYDELKERARLGLIKMDDNHLSQLDIHYLYVRSFDLETIINKDHKEAYEYYLGQAQKYATNFNLYSMGLMALALNRNDKIEKAKSLANSILEYSIVNEELGRYWKMDASYHWYQMPIESQSLFIEMFYELDFDSSIIEEMQIWLLKHKQTNRWKTTKATSAAIYALLINQKTNKAQWIDSVQLVDVQLGGQQVDINTLHPEAGTGYFKHSWNAKELNRAMGEITANNPNEQIAWGAAYWQYFEDLDKIKHFENTPLKISKTLHKLEQTDKGEVLKNISEFNQLNIGDQVKVRIQIEVDRPMEFVHLKDMRSSGFEPTSTLSQGKWQDGLWYYESPKDLATHFFIDYLPKGTFVFEYSLRVAHSGTFSNGITTMQCMYAPEFLSHSNGVKVKVD